MTTTINGDNGTYLNVDMWYGNEFVPGQYGADSFFNDNSAIYWGWIYDENGKMIGSYETDDSVLVQENFQIAWTGEQRGADLRRDIRNIADTLGSTTDVLAASSCDDLKSTISNMLNSVQNTINKTDTNPDSYNMGFLDGELYVLRKLNDLAGNVTACDSINCATEPKYMANMVSASMSFDGDKYYIAGYRDNLMRSLYDSLSTDSFDAVLDFANDLAHDDCFIQIKNLQTGSEVFYDASAWYNDVPEDVFEVTM